MIAPLGLFIYSVQREGSEMEPRQYTTEEVREMFLARIRSLVKEWASKDYLTVERRLEGLAFSICAQLDGCAPNLPAFAVIPIGDASDEAYCRENGTNWFPNGAFENDIAGSLHERLVSGAS